MPESKPAPSLPEPTPAGYAVLMVRDNLANLPDWRFPFGYGMRPIQPGEEGVWTDIQRDAEPFFTPEDSLFAKEFGFDPENAFTRVFLVTDPKDKGVGTMGAWYDHDFEGDDSGRIHWVATRQNHQGKGLAKASLAGALRVLAKHHRKAYLATQTKRLPAIAIYLDAGFRPHIRSEQDRTAWTETASTTRKPEHGQTILKTVEASR